MFRTDIVRYKGGDGTRTKDWRGIEKNIASTRSEFESVINQWMQRLRKKTGWDWNIEPNEDTRLALAGKAITSTLIYEVRNSVTDDWFLVFVMFEGPF
mgnify:CR=1 FL=1|tara:strand:- start:110 stop:403 length:294 start_codon:yes stop_codon:yes gene_type:complete